MLKILSILAGSLLVAGILSVSNRSNAGAAVSGPSHDDRLIHAYSDVRTGMPVSELEALGLDTAKAEHLSATALIERFIPREKIAFNTLNPAVKKCFLGPECTAYIFDDYTAQAVVLVQGGRVTWKIISNSIVAKVALPWATA